LLGSSGTPIPITLASMLLQAKDVRSNAGAKVTIGKKDYYIAPKLPTRSIALEEFLFFLKSRRISLVI